MKVTEVCDVIKKLYINNHDVSFLLLGSTGIGKSENINKLAKELKLPLLELDLSIVEPVDLLGLPSAKENSFEYLPVKNLYDTVIKQPGILFLDELTNVQRTDVLSAALRIVLDRRIGVHKLHEKTIVIAAGNRLEDSSLATEMPVPLINRFVVLEVDKPSVEDWINYMSDNYEEWDRSTAAFLSKFPTYLHHVPVGVTQTLEQVATPRSWTKLALIAKDIENDYLLEEIASGLVGREAASHFMSFRNTKLPNNAELRNNFRETWSNISVAAKYMVAMQYREKQQKDIVWFLNQLANVSDHEIMVLTLSLLPAKTKPIIVKEIVKYHPQLKNTLVDLFKDLKQFVNDG